MMNRWLCLLTLCLMPGLAPAQPQDARNGMPILLQEDFRTGMGEWQTAGGKWAVTGESLVCSTEDTGNAIAYHALTPQRNTQIVEAVVRVQRRLIPDGWNFAGIGIFRNPSEFWMLGLTEAPDGRRYPDFLETMDGRWQAQTDPDTALEAVGTTDKDLEWVPGKPYRLQLIMDTEGVAMNVFDVATGAREASARFAFGRARALRAGFAGVIVRGSEAAIESFAVAGERERAADMADLTVETGPKGSVAMLDDDLPGADRAAVAAFAATLRRAGYGVTMLSAAQVCDDTVLHPERFFLYVIPACKTYPTKGRPALDRFIRGRGHVLFGGGPAFEDPVDWRNGVWLNREGAARLRRNTPPERTLFDPNTADLARWTRGTDNPDAPGRFAAARIEGEAVLRYESGDYSGWDGYLSPPVPNLFGEGHDLLCFKAKGDRNTPQLAVELQEEDGSRWIATVPISTRWEPCALAPDDFRYWADSPTKTARGGPGDRVNPAKARRINFGLASTHTRQVVPGKHEFLLKQVGTAKNPVADFEAATESAEPLETVFPSYKVWELQGTMTLKTCAEAAGMPSVSVPCNAPLVAIPRTMGSGYERGQKWRHIPIAEAVDPDGRGRGPAVWLLLNRTMPNAGSVFIGAGLTNPADLANPEIAGLLVATVDRVRGGLFLAEAGTTRFMLEPGEQATLGARVLNAGREAARVVVAGTVVAENGTVLFDEAMELTVPSNNSAATGAVTLPLPAEPGVYTARARLLADNQVVDTLEHEFAVANRTPVPREGFVTVRESDFMLRGRKWYPVGINFWPLYVSGMDQPDYWAGWMDRRYYEPKLVEDDLRRLRDLGINMVSIQAPATPHARNLLDFLRRCAVHEIKVNLFVGLASPLGFNETGLSNFLAATRLPENPTVFAYDTIWEPGNYVFKPGEREKWDPDWRAWLDEQYGSVESAEKDWGFRLPGTDAGEPRSPLDVHFTQDGDWRVMTAAYRRFMDDLMSAKWNRATRRLRELDPNHLVSFRQGNTLPWDFAFTATAKHIDFVCPEGYSIRPGKDGYNAAGFITRYVHFTTGGKPVIWSEFGTSVWDAGTMRPLPAVIRSQAEYHEMFYRMVLEAGANGTAPWWWVGGYRVDEHSDFGIMDPDGTPRPAAELIRTYGPRIRADRAYPKNDTWFVFDRDAHPGGYWYAAFNTGRDAYRDAVAEGKGLGVRSPGTGTTSVTAPMLAVGNVPATGRNPHKFLNAEFNQLDVLAADGTWVPAEDGSEIRVANGKPVRFRANVGNTGEATWITPEAAGNRPGGVILTATPASGIAVTVPLTVETPRLKDADLGEFASRDPVRGRTAVELRMSAAGRTGFGEKRTFVLLTD